MNCNLVSNCSEHLYYCLNVYYYFPTCRKVRYTYGNNDKYLYDTATKISIRVRYFYEGINSFMVLLRNYWYLYGTSPKVSLPTRYFSESIATYTIIVEKLYATSTKVAILLRKYCYFYDWYRYLHATSRKISLPIRYFWKGSDTCTLFLRKYRYLYDTFVKVATHIQYFRESSDTYTLLLVNIVYTIRYTS